MKKAFQYTSIIIASISLVACKGSIEKAKDLAAKVVNITIDKVVNPSVTYGTAYDIDSNVYKTIKVGKYEWFAQNLQTTKLQDGTPIKNVSDNDEWKASKEPAYCSYNNTKTASVNGFLYNHKVVATKKICPQGWEVASDSAWTNLAKSLNGDQKAGISLKSKIGWDDQNATNESGFSAIPSGFRERDGKFYIMGENGLWWSATEHNEDNSMYYYIDNNTSLNHSHIYRKDGLSIRCVKLIK
jgi:uncharacterized protein (TIGR02145 family)